ncbi:hypothetical protein ACFFV7_52820 [Nonomuraea spiralis]|uniref:Uncharacterized protein n=1 Tax=Nonomuraea spiralis TaxID=46182 RepID=A0ABV5IZI2_9ACTN|nr:hypothetical protein [Nonomuraea spiralis]
MQVRQDVRRAAGAARVQGGRDHRTGEGELGAVAGPETGYLRIIEWKAT